MRIDVQGLHVANFVPRYGSNSLKRFSGGEYSAKNVIERGLKTQKSLA